MKLLPKTLSFLGIIALCTCLFAPTLPAGQTDAPAKKLRVLVVTGGHDFEKEPFFKVFQDNDRITFQTVEHPKAEAYFKPELAKQYDVLVLYDMWPKISDEDKANFINLIKQGKGLVALHHCLGSYQNWDEYTKIIGGKYHLDKYTENGVEKPGSTYQHDVDFKVHVAAPDHPVTRGIQDFAIHDETYGKFSVLPSVTPLLTTTEPTSGKTIAWAHHYGKARVVYLELGHDHVAYENPNYRKLVAQAIQWVARAK